MENIVPVDLDFHITTTNVDDSFMADVDVTSISPWELISPDPKSFQMSAGDMVPYEVRNINDIEEIVSGKIILFKVDVEINGVGEYKEETEGAFAGYVSCSNGYNQACVDALKPVSIRCFPADRPDGERIKLTFPEGHLLEKIGDTYQLAQSSYKVNEIGSRKFYLHGHTPSGSMRDYEITAEHNINGCHDEAKYTIISLNVDTSNMVVFRSEDYDIPVTVRPAGCLGLASVSVDVSHPEYIQSTYDSIREHLDVRDLIEKADVTGKLDDVELSISCAIGGLTDALALTKKLKLKKRIDALWDSQVDDLYKKLITATAPGTYFKEYVAEKMAESIAYDELGIPHMFTEDRINEAALFAGARVNNSWDDLIGTKIYGNVTSSDLHDDITNESWSWDWSTKIQVDMSGGTISMDEGGGFHLSAWEWIDAVNSSGWDQTILLPQAISISANVSADGSVGHALLQGKIEGEASYRFNGVYDPETQEWSSGGEFSGFLIKIVLICSY